MRLDVSCAQRADNSPDTPVEYLLVSAPNFLVRSRLLAELSAAAGLSAEVLPIGIRINCPAGGCWRTIVQSLAARLSPPEQRDTRIAVVPASDDPMVLHHAIFQADSVARLIEQFEVDWLLDIMERDAFEVHLEPLVQFPPGRIHGYECLLRGRHQDGRLVSPGELFAAARKLNVLFALDQKARIAAVQHAASLRMPDTQFFINFLPTAIYNPDHCLRTTLEAIEAGGLQPSQITFEVVETEEVEDRKHLADILGYYRSRGFKVALDDVGAGYSTLLSLSEHRPDYIKLDGELVRRAAHSALEGKIVTDLAEAARQNGIMTIAEGIESDDHLRFALEAGIRLTQGYIHSRPSPAPLDDTHLARIRSRMRALSLG